MRAAWLQLLNGRWYSPLFPSLLLAAYHYMGVPKGVGPLMLQCSCWLSLF